MLLSACTVAVTLAKALLWLGAPAEPPSVHLERLPLWDIVAAAGELSMHMSFMFSHEVRYWRVYEAR